MWGNVRGDGHKCLTGHKWLCCSLPLVPCDYLYDVCPVSDDALVVCDGPLYYLCVGGTGGA